MLNYWWVTRPKRRLNSVPEVLATFSDISLNQEWIGQRKIHMSLEDALEEAGLKRTGDRRDQTGGGGRTYKAWLVSLGLIFVQENTKKIKLTLAGEAIMNGDSPVEVLKNQIIKYQFPSSYSLSRGVNVSVRFKIRPFKFLLKLLSDSRIESLSEEEIAKIVVVEAENESPRCFEYIVQQIIKFRNDGDAILAKDFFEKYSSSRGSKNSFDHLLDIANTIVNWLEYTQLVKRDTEDHRVRIIEDKIDEINQLLSNSPFIDRPEQHEYFQRKFGVDPKHRKDTRNLLNIHGISTRVIAINKIKQAFITESVKMPISKITSTLIDKICEKTGFLPDLVEDCLQELYPQGAIGAFLSEYFEMAFKGREQATDFELATVDLFQNVFGFTAMHVGPKGLTPDVLLLSDDEGYSAILDNKAYSKYSITNDHHNRMVHNYIGQLNNYYNGTYPLSFFSYIAGGFGSNINIQLNRIVSETGINGSAINISTMINLVYEHTSNPYTQQRIRDIFSLNRRVLQADL